MLNQTTEQNQNYEVVPYQINETQAIPVTQIDENVYLTQKQMAVLFDCDRRTISEHISNIFEEGELDKNSVIRNFRTTAEDGKQYNINHYNLDVIISVGYRVKSKRGTQFRIWATQIIKDRIKQEYENRNEQTFYNQEFENINYSNLMNNFIGANTYLPIKVISALTGCNIRSLQNKCKNGKFKCKKIPSAGKNGMKYMVFVLSLDTEMIGSIIKGLALNPSIAIKECKQLDSIEEKKEPVLIDKTKELFNEALNGSCDAFKKLITLFQSVYNFTLEN